MNPIRILEIGWLSIAAGTLGISAYQFFSDGPAVLMLGLSVIASLMYMVRKKQRIKLDRESKGKDVSVHYH